MSPCCSFSQTKWGNLTHIFGSFIENWICSDMWGGLVVDTSMVGLGWSKRKPRSRNFQQRVLQKTASTDWYSDSTEDLKIVGCFLEFQAIQDDTITSDGSSCISASIPVTVSIAFQM